MEEEPKSKKQKTLKGQIDDVIQFVLPYVTDPDDRASASLVNRSWKQADDVTRDHVTVFMCYAASPERLSRRFPNLKYLRVKGKPRAAMYGLIPDNWGGYATPWVNEIAISKFKLLQSVHFKRMIVSDLDLDVLAMAISHQLQALKLEYCSGFSTDGLSTIAKHCRKLETLLFDESVFLENDNEWLHELAQNNTSLKVLNFFRTKLDLINPQDLEILATNCPSLISVKMGEFEILRLHGFFQAAKNLEEFFGGLFDEDNNDVYLSIPPKLCRVGMFLVTSVMPLIFPIAANIRELDLAYSWLNTNDHHTLLEKVHNLEILKANNFIGDSGLQILAQNCKKLKRLRIEAGVEESDQGVTQIGLGYVARCCKELEHIHVHVTNIDNVSLQEIGNSLKNLCDFRVFLLELLPKERLRREWPLDEGVKSLLMGCKKLKRFALYLRKGALTDVGMKYIGQYSENVKYMLLGNMGISDNGLIALSQGCPKLQKLEMRGLMFSDRAIATAVMKLPSLRYIWEQQYSGQRDVSLMTRPFWNIEGIQSRISLKENEFGQVVPRPISSQLLGYYSLDDKRTDYPKTVVHLARPINNIQ